MLILLKYLSNKTSVHQGKYCKKNFGFDEETLTM